MALNLLSKETKNVNITLIKKSLPLILKFPKNTLPITIGDGSLGNVVENITEIEFKSVDSDNFLLFEIHYQPSLAISNKASIDLPIKKEDPQEKANTRALQMRSKMLLNNLVKQQIVS